MISNERAGSDSARGGLASEQTSLHSYDTVRHKLVNGSVMAVFLFSYKHWRLAKTKESYSQPEILGVAK